MLEIVMLMHRLKIKDSRKTSIVSLTISDLMIKINIIKKVIETMTMTVKMKRHMITSHRRHREINFLLSINFVSRSKIRIVFIQINFNRHQDLFMMNHIKILMKHLCKNILIEIKQIKCLFKIFNKIDFFNNQKILHILNKAVRHRFQA